MPDYRLYRLNKTHISEPPDVITAETDAQAVEKASHLMVGSEKIEVWNLARRVAILSSTTHSISFDAKQS